MSIPATRRRTWALAALAALAAAVAFLAMSAAPASAGWIVCDYTSTGQEINCHWQPSREDILGANRDVDIGAY
jgi:ferric-dicitrate binding protein FerR (iron transport regulator)